MREKEGYRFGLISIINHWTNALIFIGVLAIGFYLDYIGSGRAVRGPWMGAHQAAGAFFLGLALWRLIWRVSQGFPKDIAFMPNWQKLSAEAVHFVLLFSIIAMPVSGILMTLYSERSINVLGFFEIPAQEENELINTISSTIHESLAYIVGLTIFMHVGAVIKHHLLDKDATLIRMLRPNPKLTVNQPPGPTDNPRAD